MQTRSHPFFFSAILIDCSDFNHSYKSEIVPLRKTTPTPIIAVVDHAYTRKAELFLHGANDYITTPLIPEEILTRVKSQVLIHFWEQQNRSDNSIELKSRFLELFNSLSAESNSDDQALVKKACLHLLDDLTANTSLNQLSRLLGTNRNNLSRLFKNKFGVGVFSWIREQRMKQAANLLRFTNMTVTNICHEVGYDDSNNFSTSFKTFFGLPPQQYRKKMTGSK